MARDDTGDNAGKKHHTSRRAVLRAAGATGLALGAGGVASAQTDGTDSVVDLGNEGLTDGDSIDSYLETHLADGVEVQIPAGTYTYTGAGLGGAYANAAVVGSADGVEFQRPEDPETAVTPTITATGGTVRIENITVTGASGQAQSRWEVGAGCYFEATSAAPAGTDGSSQQHGVQVLAPGGNLTVADCDFNWAGPGTSVVDFAASGEGGSGTLSDLRVGYGDQETIFSTGWDIEPRWIGEAINVSEV